MSAKTFCLVTAILFWLGGLIHLMRVLFAVHVTIGNTVIPRWISLLVAIACGYLAYEGIKLSQANK